MKITVTALFAFRLLLFFGNDLLAADNNARIFHWEVEAGVLQTRDMEIYGYHQGNATEGWEDTFPTARLEYWSTKKESWNYGVIL